MKMTFINPDTLPENERKIFEANGFNPDEIKTLVRVEPSFSNDVDGYMAISIHFQAGIGECLNIDMVSGKGFFRWWPYYALGFLSYFRETNGVKFITAHFLTPAKKRLARRCRFYNVYGEKTLMIFNKQGA